MARKLDREQIRQLAFDQCNDKEIAAVMNTTINKAIMGVEGTQAKEADAMSSGQ